MMNCFSTRRIASNWLLRGGRFIKNPIVEFDNSTGEILSIESYSDGACVDRIAGTEFYAGVILAGWVNAHCHLELSYLYGAIEQGGGFVNFAQGVALNRNNYSEEQRVRALFRADNAMQREGVAAVGDIVNGDSSFALKSQSSIEYVNFVELFGLREKGVESIEGLLKYPDTIATPHSIYSLNDAAFRAVIERSEREGAERPISIHFMESSAERDLFNRKGELYEWYQRAGFDCDFLHYQSPAHRLVSLIPCERSVILVHNCCVEQRDIDTIMGHFTAPVYWALAPRSNHFLSLSTPPVELLQHNGLNICIGTDSLASNHSLSILDELRALDGVSLVERLDWATRGGAKALGFDHLGDIEIGKRPHINILSGIDYRSDSLLPAARITRII